MKATYLLAELLSFYFIYQLLHQLSLPAHRILLYALNPLVIVELSGNMHPEGWMVLGLSGSLYYLYQRKFTLSAFWLAMAISAKLLPLMFLPFFLRYKVFYRDPLPQARTYMKPIITVLKNLTLWRFYSTVGVFCLLAWLPLLDLSMLLGFLDSLDLYFQRFEFNASIYYVVRAIGYQVKGYNIIQIAGPLLSLFTVIFVFWTALKRPISFDTLIKRWQMALTAFFLMATIVHPWYIVTLVFFSVFTRQWYALIWSALVILSYYAYQQQNYEEHMGLIALEYLVVFVILFGESALKKKITKLTHSI
ncbi:hypothetical protein GCM10023331_25250 [Algivirga pacifica]|uniref:DUF2029 domain-containing protein n=2 Tax=Algivirga pacifica TaxID=1162670 RepID=A0ABP9DGG7_9BACT